MQQTLKYYALDRVSASFEARGFSVKLARVGGRKCLVLTAPDGKVSVTLASAFFDPLVSALAKKVSIDKQFAYGLADLLGVSTPETLEFPASVTEIEAFLQKHRSLVAKPLDSHGGTGVTVGLTDLPMVQAAIEHGYDSSGTMLLQRQIIGEELRFTIIGGKIATVLLRQTPRVVGDGHTTVAQLIKRENQVRQTLVFEYLRYPQLDKTIIPDAFLADQRVLSEGDVLELTHSTMIRGGASIYEVTDTVHDSYKQITLQLAENLNPEFLVVDMMIKDYTVPRTAQNYAFIEFNTAPSLKLYYSIRDGQHFDIVEKIADMIDSRI